MRSKTAFGIGLGAAWLTVLPAAVTPLRAAVVFRDDFDNVEVGAAPSPAVGTYNFRLSEVAEFPAIPGSKALKIIGGTDHRNFMDVTPAPQAGDTVRFEFDAALTAGDFLQFSLAHPTLGLSTSPGNRRVTILMSLRADGTLSTYNGTAHATIPGVAHTFGAMQHYALEYTLGESTVALTAGGTTVDVTGPYAATSVLSLDSVDRAYVGAGTSQTVAYVDNVSVSVVPEPLSAPALAAATGLWAAARRRPRRPA